VEKTVYLILLGLLIGFLYDFLRVMRKQTGNRVFLCILCDFTFWIITIALSFFVLYKNYSFNLRMYHFLLIFTGISIYFTFLSQFFSLITLKIFNVFEFFLKIVFTILVFCGKIIKTCFLFLTSPLFWIFKKLKMLFKLMRYKILKAKFLKRVKQSDSNDEEMSL